MLTRVVDAGRPLIARRNGQDLAAVIPLEHLELPRELQREHQNDQEAERLASTLDWNRSEALRPPPSWFDDKEDNPREPEEGPAP